MPIGETIAGAVAGAVFGYALQEASPLKKLWGEPEKKAYANALARAYDRFESSHASWTKTYFDELFLKGKAAPILARHLLRGEDLSEELAVAWLEQFGIGKTDKDVAIQVAAVFLDYLQQELRKAPGLQKLFDRISNDATAENTEQAVDILKGIASNLEENKRNSEARTKGKKFGLNDLTAATFRVDELILASIRSHERSDIGIAPEKIEKIHQLLTDGFSSEHFSSFNNLLEFLVTNKNDPGNIIKNISADLNVLISDDLRSIEFQRNAKSLKIDHPTLLWDCSCFQFDDEGVFRQIKELVSSCPIHSHEYGTDIHKLFRTGLINIRFRGMNFVWCQSPYLFPPSIDTIHMINDLIDIGAFDTSQSVLDLGSGTGALGITAAKHGTGISRLCFSEFLLTPLIYSCINLAQNFADDDLGIFSVVAHLGYDLRVRKPPDCLYGVALCNPPYLPMMKDFEGVAMSTSVAGTTLLERALVEQRRFCRKMFISFSNIALKEVEDTGVKLKPVGPERKLPFRNVYAFRDKDYINSLISQRGLIHSKTERYPYWHKVQTYIVE